MKTQIILATLLLSTLAFAGGNNPDEVECPYGITCHDAKCVCTPGPTRKAKAKKAKPAPVIVRIPEEAMPPPVPAITETPVVTPATQPAPAKTEATQPQPAEPKLVVGARVGFGFGARGPHFTEGLLGFRLHYLPAHLGVELYNLFDYGLGAQLLVYPYQGTKLNVHLNTGFLGFGQHKLSTVDVPREWDLTLGAGLEYRLFKNLALTADWRWAMPSPVFVAENGWPKFDGSSQILGQNGRYLDVKRVVGNSLTESHLVLGLMLRN
jgi:hypothetical protein